MYIASFIASGDGNCFAFVVVVVAIIERTCNLKLYIKIFAIEMALMVYFNRVRML